MLGMSLIHDLKEKALMLCVGLSRKYMLYLLFVKQDGSQKRIGFIYA